jgi:hypothetical protein
VSVPELANLFVCVCFGNAAQSISSISFALLSLMSATEFPAFEF